MGIEGKLAELQERQNVYRCNADLTINGVAISEKTMTPIIAATAVGKSTLTKRILELAEKWEIDAAEAGTETTRPWRPGDAENHRSGVSYDEMISKIENSEYPNWSITPSNHIYATPPDSLIGEHNFLPCLPSSLPMLQRAGFKAVNAFYIVTSAEAWDKQIEERKGLPDFAGRLEEAKQSLEFARQTVKLQKVTSEPGEENLSRLALKILDFVKEGKEYNSNQFQGGWEVDFKRYSRAMYSWAIDLAIEHDKSA